MRHPKPDDWPSYNGNPGGNRYSGMEQINTQNVDKLQLKWSYSLPYSGLETTPLVLDGVMYVSGPNHACALDARSGREIWCHTHPADLSRTAGRGGAGGRGAAAVGRGIVPANAGGGGSVNRGLAVVGDRVFLSTEAAHLVCLNRLTGAVMWEVVMPETAGGYSGPPAPLIVDDLVVAGVAGGTVRCGDFSPRTKSRPANKRGVSGRYRSAESPVPIRGPARDWRPAAAQPG